jgi:hypothetical protein
MHVVSMMIRRLLLLVLFAAVAIRADEREQLVKRLHIDTVEDRGQVGVYDRYPSRRPRLVIAATHTSFSDGEVLLIRLPDSNRGSGKIADRQTPDTAPYEISFVHLVDPKDVSVDCFSKHGNVGVVYRVRGERLVEIADTFAGPSNTPDLDGDGIPEIVWNAYVGHNECGVHLVGGVDQWNGTEYVSDGKHYAAITSATVGQESGTYEFHAPESSFEPLPSHYLLHLYRGRGVTSLQVRVDDEQVSPGKRLDLEVDCHTLDVAIQGKRGATAWVMIEERHDVKSKKLP